MNAKLDRHPEGMKSKDDFSFALKKPKKTVEERKAFACLKMLNFI